MEENGMISKAQRLYVEFSASNAKMEWQKAINQSNIVRDALSNTLGDSIDIQPISELFLLKEIEPLSFFQQSAINNNPQLKQVGSKKSLAKQNYNIQKSDFFPTVAVVGNKELVAKDLSNLMPNWLIGVNLNWTLFDGAARGSKIKSAKATMEMVDFIDTKAKSDISTYINKLYNELQMHVEQLETMEKTYEFVSEYLRVQKKAFAEGFATSKDVVDAELAVNKVKTGRVKVLNDYVLSLAKLLEFSGQTNLFLQYSQRENREGETFE
jgi:outer membrane protein TolC